MQTRTIDPSKLAVKDLHQFILGTIAPRPIAFASTIDSRGVPNLAPYSFFNAFSSNPPVLVFSSNRKVKNNETKDTLRNVMETREVVINAVNFAMMRQMTLASIEFPSEVNEFEKAGFTPLASDVVKPFRVAESPAQLECRVRDIIVLGDQGGAGHLILCDVVRLHIHESVIDDHDRIDPHKIDLVGRMGRAFYVRASGAAVHTVVQPVEAQAIGFDGLPVSIRHSAILTGGELAEIAALSRFPGEEDIQLVMADPQVIQLLGQPDAVPSLHHFARQTLAAGSVERAAAILILADRISGQ